jgi:hypothetical protein
MPIIEHVAGVAGPSVQVLGDVPAVGQSRSVRVAHGDRDGVPLIAAGQQFGDYHIVLKRQRTEVEFRVEVEPGRVVAGPHGIGPPGGAVTQQDRGELFHPVLRITGALVQPGIEVGLPSILLYPRQWRIEFGLGQPGLTKDTEVLEQDGDVVAYECLFAAVLGDECFHGSFDCVRGIRSVEQVHFFLLAFVEPRHLNADHRHEPLVETPALWDLLVHVALGPIAGAERLPHRRAGQDICRQEGRTQPHGGSPFYVVTNRPFESTIRRALGAASGIRW